MLPKAHLASHWSMSGSRWVITPSWLSGSWRSFLYSSSVYSCPLFLISCASVRSMPFLSFIVPILAWNVPLVSLIFLKRSLIFPILSFSFISLHWSLRKAFLSLLAIFWNSAFKWVYHSFSPFLFTSLLFAAISQPVSLGPVNIFLLPAGMIWALSATSARGELQEERSLLPGSHIPSPQALSDHMTLVSCFCSPLNFASLQLLRCRGFCQLIPAVHGSW